MIVVVEGPDNSGKTTLAHRLAKDLGGMYLKTHVRPVTPLVLREFVRISRELAQSFPPLILDRHHAISEPIYGRILRGGYKVDAFECTMLCQSLNVIYCRPPTQNIHNFDPQVSQLRGVVENTQRIIDEYDRVFRKTPKIFYSFREYDYTKDEYPTVLTYTKGLE